MIRYVIFFTMILILLTFSISSSDAQEQIVFVSEKDGNGEIYRQVIGGNIERLTFEPASDFDPSLSPDGTKIAFVSGRVRGTFDIYIMNIKSPKQRRLTFSFRIDIHPSWAPDGKRIAFASERDGDLDIYTMDAKGQKVTQLTDSPGDDSQPDWSPNGKKLVFTSDRDGGVAQVYLLDIQTGLQQRLTNSHYITQHPRWSPDGKQIAFLSGAFEDMPRRFRQIWIMKRDGTNVEALVVDGEGNYEPSFSPNGKRIAFTSWRNDNRDIYSVNIDTKLLTRLTHHPDSDYAPDWSPDGERIIFVSHRTGNADIHMMNVNVKKVINLTRSEGGEGMPAWSPKGDKIAFVRYLGDGNQSEIYVMDSNGNNQVKVADTPVLNLSPTWSPQGNKIAFVNFPDWPDLNIEHSRVYIIDADGQNKQLLFEQPEGFIQKISWSPDGKQIIFTDTKQRVGTKVCLIDIITRNIREIAPPSVHDVSWSPNGQEIAFSALPPFVPPKFRHGIYFMDSSGNIQRTIWPPPHLSFEYLERFTWSPDGRKILVSSNGNLYSLDLANEEVKLFIKSANSPDWKDPSRSYLVSPQNKHKTTWGEIKCASE